MIRMINGITKTEMWVADDRVDEYKAAGHTLPSDSEKPTVKEDAQVEKTEEKVEKPKKATKTTKKK